MLPIAIWLVAIVLGGALFFRKTPNSEVESPPSWGWLGLIVGVAAITRLYHIQSVPSGAFVDELFTLRNTLAVMERPLDLFGVTPLINEGWVVTSNLYLTFNSFIVSLVGVNYLAIKLFSVIPGVLTCGFFFLACTRLFPAKIAVTVSFLLVFGHWHLRLSRYGWDATFLIMTLAAALWLLLLATKERPLPAYLAGVATSIGLYSYISGRLCLLALGAYLVIMALRSRERSRLEQLGAFALGVVTTAGPRLWYFVAHAQTTWVRTSELSIFHREDPTRLLMENIVGHALMFNVHGGTYARDNFPGLPMLDPLTGLLFLGGVIVIVLQWRKPRSLMLALLMMGTLAGGIFSASQEGAPYVYRVSAVIVPTFILVGIGLEELSLLLSRWNWYRQKTLAVAWLSIAVLVFTIPTNLYQYFGLEAHNISATRVMSNRFRVIGKAIHLTKGPIYLVSPGITKKMSATDSPDDPYARFNGEVMYDNFGPGILALALVVFADDYKITQTLKQNFDNSRIGTLEAEDLDTDFPLPVAILVAVSDSNLTTPLRARYADQDYRETLIPGAMGNPLFRLVTIQPKSTR